jgi:hypothetical protein
MDGKRLKLNEKILREAEPAPGVSDRIFDTKVIGFAARVQASGTRTFTIDDRHAGRKVPSRMWSEFGVTESPRSPDLGSRGADAPGAETAA